MTLVSAQAVSGDRNSVPVHEGKPHVAAVQLAPGVHDQAEPAPDRTPPPFRREYR